MTVSDCYMSIKDAKNLLANIECKFKTLTEEENAQKDLISLLENSKNCIESFIYTMGNISIDGNGNISKNGVCFGRM